MEHGMEKGCPHYFVNSLSAIYVTKRFYACAVFKAPAVDLFNFRF
jgi:hypothetical protein